MKRLCIIVSLVLVFLLSSCTNSVDDETHWLFDGSFNSSANTKEEVLDKIEFYKGELETIIGEGYESEFSKISGPTFLSNDGDLYRRETDFTYYDENRDNTYMNDMDSESIINAHMTLEELKNKVNACEDYVEGDYCITSNEEGTNEFHTKAYIEDERLYIESYSTTNAYNYESVNAEIMYYNIVDDKIMFEYVRDYRDNMSRNLYFDRFIEGETMINIAIEEGNYENIYYQETTNENVFLYVNRYGESAINYLSIEDGKTISLDNGTEGGSRHLYIGYLVGSNDLVYYREFENEVSLTWNLLEVSGWDYLWTNDVTNSRLYEDYTKYTTNESIVFDESISLDTYMNSELRSYVTLRYEGSEMSEGIFDLTDYGLLFDKISYEEVTNDIENIDEYLSGVVGEYSFNGTNEENYNYIALMFPFFSDEDKVDELFSGYIY